MPEMNRRQHLQSLVAGVAYAAAASQANAANPNVAYGQNTIPDGIRIMRFILRLCKEYRPLRFFGALAGLCLLGALVVGPGRAELPAWAAWPAIGPRLATCQTVQQIASHRF